MERVGTGLEQAVGWLRRRADEREDRKLGEQALAEREAIVLSKHEVEVREPVLVVPAVVDVPKSERVVREKQRPLFRELPIRRCRRWPCSTTRRPARRPSAPRRSSTRRA
jgi:S-DNA-T family DNA segregation ATPase FtsK/SpoIIIE